MYRSLLYVPASSERFIARAAHCGADAIILDLEDSVAPDQKRPARENLASSIPRCAEGGADIWVRINRPLSLAVRDVEAAVQGGAAGILITKAEGPEHIQLLLEAAEQVERENGRREPLKAIAVIESVKNLAKADGIACSHQRVIGLMGGSEDLALSMGAQPTRETLKIPKMLVHMAAAGAGKFSFGLFGSVADYADTDLMRELAQEAVRHGISGATCVHPSVIPILNEAFTPPAAEVAKAEAIIEAAEQHTRSGIGAFRLDGKMIDEPVVERARRLLERARGHRR
ncbi:MAG: CoA ester lyase [Proteobacteria bacterium]|nr:CoA ester lyase [Pseudomonadota bacterium]